MAVINATFVEVRFIFHEDKTECYVLMCYNEDVFVWHYKAFDIELTCFDILKMFADSGKDNPVNWEQKVPFSLN